MSTLLAVPTNELVAIAWAQAVAGDQVGTNLPSDVTKWADSGFVQLTCVGGAPNADYPMLQPVISVDCWAARPNSNKPPWGKANALAQLVLMATYSPTSGQQVLTLDNSLGTVRVQSVWPLTEPRRMLDDAAGYARYQFDLQMIWTRQ